MRRRGEALVNFMAIAQVPGSFGTSISFLLRVGQAIVSSASLLFMSFGDEFYSYISFCYLVTIMGLVLPWSISLAILEAYSLLFKCPLRWSGILSIITIGDWVLSILTLAAASSTASILDVFFEAEASICPVNICRKYQISAAMAFFSWFISMVSSLSNFWLLPSVS